MCIHLGSDILKAHFFHPVDDSLAEKARAYTRVYAEWKNILASFEYFERQGWEDTLGSRQELLEAQQTIENTLDVAIASFSSEDKAQLIQNSLIKEDEIAYLESRDDNKSSIIQARKDEMNKVRSSNTLQRDIENDK